MTQPALSNTLAKLRLLFEDPLLVRAGRGMALTSLAPAPSAARMANSVCRAAERASRRFATLAQAISSTSPQAAPSIAIGLDYRENASLQTRLYAPVLIPEQHALERIIYVDAERIADFFADIARHCRVPL